MYEAKWEIGSHYFHYVWLGRQKAAAETFSVWNFPPGIFAVHVDRHVRIENFRSTQHTLTLMHFFPHHSPFGWDRNYQYYYNVKPNRGSNPEISGFVFFYFIIFPIRYASSFSSSFSFHVREFSNEKRTTEEVILYRIEKRNEEKICGTDLILVFDEWKNTIVNTRHDTIECMKPMWIHVDKALPIPNHFLHIRMTIAKFAHFKTIFESLPNHRKSSFSYFIV